MTTSFFTTRGLILPSKYVASTNVSVASNTTLTISTGTEIDSTDTLNITNGSSITVNAAVTGANGIDTGTFAASTWYYVHIIKNSRNLSAYPVAGLISTSRTAPVMPDGYDSFRHIGCELTDGSIHFLPCTNLGAGTTRKKIWDSDISVLSGGTASTLTAISLAAAVPAMDNINTLIDVDFTPATASDKVSFTSYGLAGTVLPHIAGSVAAKVNSGQLQVVAKLSTATPTILYINSAGSGATSVWVHGFEYYL